MRSIKRPGYPFTKDEDKWLENYAYEVGVSSTRKRYEEILQRVYESGAHHRIKGLIIYISREFSMNLALRWGIPLGALLRWLLVIGSLIPRFSLSSKRRERFPSQPGCFLRFRCF